MTFILLGKHTHNSVRRQCHCDNVSSWTMTSAQAKISVNRTFAGFRLCLLFFSLSSPAMLSFPDADGADASSGKSSQLLVATLLLCVVEVASTWSRKYCETARVTNKFKMPNTIEPINKMNDPASMVELTRKHWPSPSSKIPK
jgi:hypothetical protein